MNHKLYEQLSTRVIPNNTNQWILWIQKLNLSKVLTSITHVLLIQLLFFWISFVYFVSSNFQQQWSRKKTTFLKYSNNTLITKK